MTTQDDAERNFWHAFTYDPTTNRWLVARGLSPMDVLDIAAAKAAADHRAVTDFIRSTRWRRRIGRRSR